MPSTIDLGWSVQDMVDVLAYAQTLPTGEVGEVEEVLPETGGSQLLTPVAFIGAGLLALSLGLALVVAQLGRRVRA
jgi:hypothetical protein